MKDFAPLNIDLISVELDTFHLIDALFNLLVLKMLPLAVVASQITQPQWVPVVERGAQRRSDAIAPSKGSDGHALTASQLCVKRPQSAAPRQHRLTTSTARPREASHGEHVSTRQALVVPWRLAATATGKEA